MIKQYKLNTILVVDDENLIRISICRMLNKLGYQSISAENGQVALDILNDQKVDLIILDLLMPIKSGYDFLKEMKLNSPVIIISAFSGPVEMDTQFKNHAQVIGYIKKPFDNLNNLITNIESKYENYIRKIQG